MIDQHMRLFIALPPLLRKMSSIIRQRRLYIVNTVVIGLLAIYFSVYWMYYELGIFCVNSGEFGVLIWCSGPPGSFFPLPVKSGALAVISPKQSNIDYLLHFALIRSYLVYVLPLVFVLLTLFRLRNLIRIR